MSQSFKLMDSEVGERSKNNAGPTTSMSCREYQTPQCDAVGSTTVVSAVTPEKIIVSNCGDSRNVLCRKGVAIPLSSDHKQIIEIENRSKLKDDSVIFFERISCEESEKVEEISFDKSSDTTPCQLIARCLWFLLLLNTVRQQQNTAAIE
ncbi:protein phosphatase 2C 37-like [Spinacia oleracea]|uniref:Protein phosphatase 2C 37-like n=1 Tax=Spinacia oleracea TaxID=3562 RepID=A0A9R0JF52_SPIOL|nr:protein phosphatase 2C 37-like [Spinacia oleracea]